MPLSQRSTLTQFLIEERRRYPGASGDFNALILDVALACKAIARAVAQPDWAITLLDANHKKTTFLRQAVIELGLPNVEVVCERAEAFTATPLFDVITSRAFADLAEFVRLTRHVLREGGVWAALKGVYPYEEIALLPKDVTVVSVTALHVPGLDAERHLVVLARC